MHFLFGKSLFKMIIYHHCLFTDTINCINKVFEKKWALQSERQRNWPARRTDKPRDNGTAC